MLNLVTGKQRSGKSYCVVSMMIDYLRSCKRPIYTNLPINPDSLCHVACGGRLRNPALYNAYMMRLHLFVNFSGRSRANFSIFRKKNPDFVKLYHSTFDRKKISQNLLIPCGKENFIVRQFWRYTSTNSIVFLDEVYEIFGAIDQLKQGKEARKEMLSYAKQHGHFKDDLFLITHDPADIDKIIRKSLNKQYIIQNSKYKNIFEHKAFKGLRWPIQFFIVKGYEYGERESQDRYNVFPKQAVFNCYNSFNVSDFLEKDMASDEMASADTKIDHGANWKNFIKQAGPLFLLLFCGAVGFGAFLFVGYKYFLKQSSNGGGGGDAVPKVDQMRAAKQPQKSEAVTVRLITPRNIILSNGERIEKGGNFNGYKIEKITADFIAASRGGRNYRFSLRGFRRSLGETGASNPAGNGSGSAGNSGTAGNGTGTGSNAGSAGNGTGSAGNGK